MLILENLFMTERRKVALITGVTGLYEWGVRVRVSDPWADAEEVYRDYEIRLAETDEAHPVDALIIAVDHHLFMGKTAAELKKLFKPRQTLIIADLKSAYPREVLESSGFKVFRL
jgi:UDP-N-acetyl-D-galactosamine dehydrogenase